MSQIFEGPNRPIGPLLLPSSAEKRRLDGYVGLYDMYVGFNRPIDPFSYLV